MTNADRSTGLRSQISRYVVDQILRGAWAPGDRIPSEQALTVQFGVSRMTVHHALRDVAARGLVVRRAGSGSFVAAPSAYVSEYPHCDVIDEITRRGHRHHARVIRRALRPATPAEAAAFRIDPAATLFHALVLHHEDDVPFELEDRLVAPRFLPDAMTIDLTTQTVFARLMFVRPYREGSESVRAVSGTAAACALLRVPTGAPLLEVDRRTWSPEGVVTTARLLRTGEQATRSGRIRQRQDRGDAGAGGAPPPHD